MNSRGADKQFKKKIQLEKCVSVSIRKSVLALQKRESKISWVLEVTFRRSEEWRHENLCMWFTVLVYHVRNADFQE